MDDVAMKEAVAAIPEEVAEFFKKMVRDELEKEFQAELDKVQADLTEANKVAIETALADYKKELKPPTDAELRKILSQEYLTFEVKVGRGDKEKTFTIQELPLSKEKKILKIIKDKVIPKVKDLNLLGTENQPLEQQAQTLFEVIDPAMDLLIEATVIVLNPYDEDPEVTTQWIEDNLSSVRIWNILTTQLEVNRMRDFFSGLSRTSRRGMMTPVGTPS